jgi:hypothetical protein
MDHTTSSQTAQHSANKPVESRAPGRADESDAFPPRRISTLPPLDDREAQEGFLRSPSAVLESIGLRVPAALAAHIRRSSAPPPPPSRSAQAAEAPSEATAAATPEPAPNVEPSSTPTSIPPARRGRARTSSKKKKA